MGGPEVIVDLSVPEPKSSAWLNQQKAPLLIGQLKAIAAPFYTRLHAADPAWLESERLSNGTNHPDSIFPWTPETSDDNNKAIATIGQLKAVFSLRFATLGAPQSLDSDGDGLTDAEEAALGTNPNNPAENATDHDGDGIANELDADPSEKLIDWECVAADRYAAIELSPSFMQSGDVGCVELSDDYDLLLNRSTGGFANLKTEPVLWMIGQGVIEVIPSASVSYEDPFWGSLTRDSGAATGFVGDSIMFSCHAPVDFDFGGALVSTKNGSVYEFWQQLAKTDLHGHSAMSVGADRYGRAIVYQGGDYEINPIVDTVWELFKPMDGDVSVARMASFRHESHPDFAGTDHLSVTKEGWVSIYDQVRLPAQNLTIAAPTPHRWEKIWSQDLPKGDKPYGRVMISRWASPSGVLMLNDADQWNTPKAFTGKRIIAANQRGGFINADNQLWTRNRPSTSATAPQDGSEDWLPLRYWAGDRIADGVEQGWEFNLKSTNRHGGMAVELTKPNEVTKIFVLVPVEVAPEVLAVNSDFDEGRIDPATGYAIPDCDDMPGVDQKTGSGNTEIALNAARDHLDGLFANDEKVTDDMHKGWFGVNPKSLKKDFWDGANVTIRKIDKIDDETGYKESGQVRFYAKWGDKFGPYYGITPYDLKTLEPINLVTGGVNGRECEGVYGSTSTIPDDAQFWMEGVRPGKITLEWRYQKGNIDVKHEQTFLVETRWTPEQWKRDLAYKIRLDTANDPSGQIDVIVDPRGTERNYWSTVERMSEYYDYYRENYLVDDDYQWCGMARLAGTQAIAGISDAKYANDAVNPLTTPFGPWVNIVGVVAARMIIGELTDTLRNGGYDIFDSLAWQHHAYRSSGIGALKWTKVNASNRDLDRVFDAWLNFDRAKKTIIVIWPWLQRRL